MNRYANPDALSVWDARLEAQFQQNMRAILATIPMPIDSIESGAVDAELSEDAA